MKMILLFSSVLLMASTQATGQFFSGDYTSDPVLPELSHLKIDHHHNSEDRYHGDLSVIAFSASGYELWGTQAVMLNGEKAEFFIEKYGEGKEIKTVYEFKFELDGVEEDFILLGYKDENGKGRFLGIEEIFSDNSEEELLEIKTFHLVKKD